MPSSTASLLLAASAKLATSCEGKVIMASHSMSYILLEKINLQSPSQELGVNVCVCVFWGVRVCGGNESE